MLEVEPPVLNLSLNKENGELNDQRPPFVIRGHHLWSYIRFLKSGSAGKKISPIEEARFRRRLYEATSLMSDNEDERVLLTRAYTRDIVGTSTESADRYEERIKEVFERFVSLPDDYPAELTEKIPDMICAACAIGNHCRELGSPNGDRIYLNVFLQNLNSLNLPKPTISHEEVHFPDTQPQQVRRIKTTLGTVKKILKEGNSPLWDSKF